MNAIRDRILSRFAWIDGHADVWRLFADGQLFAEIVASLAGPFQGHATRVAGIESRGFLLGAAVAVHLRVGFVAIRKEHGLFPGAKIERRTLRDYRGHESLLRLQRRAVEPGDRVLVVDDWVELGSQALAAKALLEDAGAALAGVSVIVDDTTDEVRQQLRPFAALVAADELGPSA